MDIDHPDPGTTSQFTFFAETPVDAEAFVLMGAGEAVAAETAPPPYCSDERASYGGVTSSVSNPSSSEGLEPTATSHNGERVDEDSEMGDPGPAQSKKIEGNVGPIDAIEKGYQDTRNTDLLANQDTAMANQASPAHSPISPEGDVTMPDESSLLDSRGSRSLSGGNYSSDSGFGGYNLAGNYEARNQKLDITQRNVPTPQHLSYLPPQPYGSSPYPPVAEAAASNDTASTQPLPPSPTISYASTADLDRINALDLEATNVETSSASRITNLAKGAETVDDRSPNVPFGSSRADSHPSDPPGSTGGTEHLSEKTTQLLGQGTDFAQSSTIPTGPPPFGQGPPFSAFGTQVSDGGDPNHLDLLPRIKGLFRLLDLYSERSDSGLVDKVIISQISLGQFINTILPGAYASVTKIDFNRLDREARLPLIGIYGSKSEIIRFLQAAGSIDDDVAGLLQLPEDISIQTRPTLRSGIYILDPPNGQSQGDSIPPTRYVIYWPESATWDDSSTGSVRKNRVTFMRYLTCLTDQIRCLISPEHENSLIFDDADSDSDDDAFESTWGDQDDGKGVSDRFFKFEVAKTNEQEEDAHIREGFTIEHHILNQNQASLPNGRSLSLQPRLLSGETIQAFATLRFISGMDKEENLGGKYNPTYLKSVLKQYSSIVIPDTIEETELDIILGKGDLGLRVPLEVTTSYKKAVEELNSRYEAEKRSNIDRGLRDAKDKLPKLEAQTRLFLANRVLGIYSSLEWDHLFPDEDEPVYGATEDPLDYFHVISAASPLVKEALGGYMKEPRFGTISFEHYRTLKRPFLILRNILDKHGELTDEKKEILVQSIMQEDSAANASGPSTAGWNRFNFNPIKWGKSLLPKLGFTTEDVPDSQIKSYSQVQDQPDPAFLSSLHDTVTRHPLLAENADRLKDLAMVGLREKIGLHAKSLAIKLNLAFERQLKEQCAFAATAQNQMARTEAFSQYRRGVQESLKGSGGGPTLNITWIKQHWTRTYREEVEINASTRRRMEPMIGVSFWILDLLEDDRQRLHDDPTYIPTPRIPQRPPLELQIPLNWDIRRVQMLSPRKCLLVVDAPDKTRIWIFSPHSGPNLDNPIYSIPSVSDRKYVIAVDERKRVLAFIIMSTTLCSLQQYTIDIDSSSMHSRGSPFNLTPWYDGSVPKITHAAFFSGTDDLCLAEASGRMRIFSIPQQNFRPATIQLDACPLFIRSSPDGSAMLVIDGTQGAPQALRVFHHASFGSNITGIVNPLPRSFLGVHSFSVTSIGERGKVFVMGLKPATHAIVSACVDISRKEIEYQFRAKDDGPKSQSKSIPGNNTVITCFSEVWERFPVVAAIQRETISPATRQPSSLTFVCGSPSRPFSSYFRQMVRTFEETSKKPIGQRLASIHISSMTFDSLEWKAPPSSNFKAGEWIVELLCLIPIHIAVTNENRFTPLKDGVFDPVVERELLGANVSRIIDSISLGWYESIFSAYMASKPVKVISSMGEQSVGKSYSLNHMIDSSFAGSAVRTTEGVWLSACPTRDFLVVAMDFEGVHSTERTPQEDMLLVLFNTALSNLIIFRNNFALSRDVANMFTSFQASTHLFDPKSNPKLFKGLLAIVIKDVVDADKKDIVKEFSSKFGQIVSKEQASNFITVLHDSQLTVIPWSVILSPDFYRLFGKLGKTLFNQKTTHDTAGGFLITLKTLMAKMKAQDWGSLDHTVIKHRVTALTGLLPRALTLGRLGPEAEDEELKNMDNQNLIPGNDTAAIFYIFKEDNERAAALAKLIKEWNSDAARLPTNDLVQYLQGVSAQRIRKVREWIEHNVARFPQDNSDMRGLWRHFEDLSEALLANIQICLADCSTCRLRCLLHRSHLSHQHDCGTSHDCIDSCDYLHDHETLERCGLQAGHSGRHICDPFSHLCGEPCTLNTRRGCQKHCTRPSHEEHTEHMCAARMHLCGELCDLQEAPLQGGRRFSCNLPCTLPYDQDHSRHMCDNRIACPIQCELCPRNCAMGDHFHGIDDDAIHLCGQSHGCDHKCEAPGICEVDTTPHSVETTFTGRLSTFSYTKFTQVANRRDCGIRIPPGARQHSGPHIHSDDPECFHFCEGKCLNCGYFCTLRLNHQGEHNTAHGSMELTAWAVEGNRDAAVEVQGRRFAAQDNGAPQLCSSICRNLGRHAHIDYCRNAKGECREDESEHITARMLPHPDRLKDWISHKVFWARTGFRDPYSVEEQAEFALCNAQCAGPEHDTTGNPNARPSYCTLNIFHPPQPIGWNPPGNASYVSNDGHSFGCPNPNNLRQSFHVIFVLDRSGSMESTDRRPLPGQPVSATISSHNDNRFGAVLSAVYGFWISRGSGNQGTRRDAYSVITFQSSAQVRFANDLTSTPEQLLNSIVQERAGGGTNFDAALRTAQTTMETHWSTERSPVLIFLSDGQCGVSDNVVYDICNRAGARGKPLSFHSVSFGPRSDSLRRMVTVAEQIAANAPRDPLAPLVPCGYTDVLDTIRLAETFLNIADSLKKPRAALLRS